MTRTGPTSDPRPAGTPWPRVVARVHGESPGPLLVVVAGMHGNEPAGLEAAARVAATLERQRTPLAGDLVVLSGNRGALARGVRFVQRDLNRHWTEVRLATLRADAANPGVSQGPEDREQVELLDAFDGALAGARGRKFVVDLHTTSAEGVPFAMIGDHLRHRAFGLAVPLPLLLGLIDSIGGTLLEYADRRGCVALGIEGGQHASSRSAENHESVLWLALVAAGLVRESDVADLEAHRARLAATAPGLPRALRVYHRHHLEPSDAFAMEPGFANVQRITRGTLLAHDVHGEIRAERDELLVMPLYQKMGEDGFFLGREIPAPVFRLGAWLGWLKRMVTTR